MHKRYVHWFNNQGSNAVLKAEGLISEEESGIEKLRPLYCSNCNESNTKNAKWCVKCGMILSFAGYREALQEQKKKEDELKIIKEQFNNMQSQLQMLISTLGNACMNESERNSMARNLYDSGIIKEAIPSSSVTVPSTAQ